MLTAHNEAHCTLKKPSKYIFIWFSFHVWHICSPHIQKDTAIATECFIFTQYTYIFTFVFVFGKRSTLRLPLPVVRAVQAFQLDPRLFDTLSLFDAPWGFSVKAMLLDGVKPATTNKDTMKCDKTNFHNSDFVVWKPSHHHSYTKWTHRKRSKPKSHHPPAEEWSG